MLFYQWSKTSTQVHKYVPLGHYLATIYDPLIKPYFVYCDIVWGNLTNELATRLQKLQNRAARIVTNQGYDVRSATILKELNWDELATRRDKHLCFMVHNAINKRVPDYLCDLFIKSSDCPYKSKLRDNMNNLQLSRIPRTECYKGSFSYRGVHIWNSLPADLKGLQSKPEFKNKIKRFYSD